MCLKFDVKLMVINIDNTHSYLLHRHGSDMVWYMVYGSRRPRFPMLCTLCLELVGLETLHCSSISGFKCRLKTLLFRQTFSSTT